MKPPLTFLVLALMAAGVRAEMGIEVASLDDRRFELTLRSDNELSIQDAQSLLIEAAVEACAGLMPRFNTYKFTSSAPVHGSERNIETTFEFVQTFDCVPEEKPSAPVAGRTIGDEDRERIAKERANATESHFQDLTNGQFETAYGRYSSYMKGVLPYEKWQEKNQVFYTESGSLIAGGVWNVTVYVDPASAPKPGFYVATDYQFEYENFAFRCGYIVWYSEDREHYEIMRQEDGHVPRAMAESMSNEDLKKIKTQFGCKAA